MGLPALVPLSLLPLRIPPRQTSWGFQIHSLSSWATHAHCRTRLERLFLYLSRPTHKTLFPMWGPAKLPELPSISPCPVLPRCS